MLHHTNLRIGLTGGMGTGKSTAAAMFAERGFMRLDADQVVREELLPSPAVREAIRAKFGETVINADGHVRRDQLAAIVFKDPVALAWLEELLHPLLRARWREIFDQAAGEAFIAEVPLLFEKGMQNWFDFTVCVTTQSELQLRRLEQRGVPQEQARQRLARQLPLARKCELADHVLLNDGSPEFLREQVNALADRLLKSHHARLTGPLHVSPP
ncbi:dephospho-CoA kinase [Oleiharenicola lentus]|uniref:dephospho-CoA kinase n=1 Tax=Oleiharenicola lentus TaxID=2508720 RepID=UPI003F67AB7F